MKVIRTKSQLNGMFVHKIKTDDGRVYDIEKSWTGELFCNVASGKPAIAVDTIAPFSGISPDAEHKAIKHLIAVEKRNFNRRARHQARLDLGLVRVRGALGGVYYE